MEWKLTGAEPVYLQIMEHFRGAVLTGVFGPGDKIPSVRELAAAARVNPNTMQRALSELEREGLLLPHGTLGRFVTDDPAVLEKLRQQRTVRIVAQCRQLLAQVGLTLTQAAALAEEMKEE